MVNDTPDLQLLYRAICLDPREDAPRLAYADKLDDTDSSHPDADARRLHAQLIRVQVGAANLPDCGRCESRGFYYADVGGPTFTYCGCDRGNSLQSSHNLCETPLPAPPDRWHVSYNLYKYVGSDLADAGIAYSLADVSRGFVDAVAVALHTVVVKPEQLARFPLTRIHLADRYPYESSIASHLNEHGDYDPGNWYVQGDATQNRPAILYAIGSYNLGWAWAPWSSDTHGDYPDSFIAQHPAFVVAPKLWQNVHELARRPYPEDCVGNEYLCGVGSARTTDDARKWMAWACVKYVRERAGLPYIDPAELAPFESIEVPFRPHRALPDGVSPHPAA